MIKQMHYFFLLPQNPWPLLSRLNSFRLLFSLLIFIKFFNFNVFFFSLVGLIFSCFFWWLTYSGEFNLEGKNRIILELGLKFSIILFISSEIFFFFSFFWSYFHFFLSPLLETGMKWPPYGINMFDFLNVPLINTLLLLTSGITITIRHKYLISNRKTLIKVFLFLTIFLGLIFTLLQLLEYSTSFFRIRDSNFGSSFFMLTGFHGIHVLVGSIFLITILYRLYKIISDKLNCLRFEIASWYWHFVDVVWIFLFFLLYCLNN